MMFKIGIAGGIASGKSTVTRRFGELGCGIICADSFAHKVLQYPEVVDQIRARWCVQSNGCVGRDDLDCSSAVLIGPNLEFCNRPAIAEVVFKNPAERSFLEAVMHPLISQEMHQSLERYNDSYIPAVVLDVPLLFEGHWRHLCSTIVFVDCPDAERENRYKKRTGQNDFEARESVQWAPAKKAAHSDHVLDNTRNKKHLCSQVDDLWFNVLIEKIKASMPVNHYLFWRRPNE